MPLDEYFKSYSFKLINMDVLYSTIAVFAILLVIPPLTDFESLQPFRKAVEDFDITDIYFSPDIRGEQPAETDITIIQAAVNTREGLTEVSDINYLKLVNAIAPYQPKVIGIDHKFDDSPDAKAYNAIKGIFGELDNLILSHPFLVNENGEISKLEIPEESALYGLNLAFDNITTTNEQSESSVRNFRTRYISENDTSYHYSVELARKFNPDAVDRFLIRDNDFERINYRGNVDKFKIINARDIIKGNFEESDINNKIVMIGFVGTNMAVADVSKLYFTPLNENTSGRTFPDMYKLIIDANIVSMLLTDEYFDKLSLWATVTFAFLLCYSNMLFFGYVGYKNPKMYELTALLTFMVETFAIGYLTVYLFEAYNMESNFTLAIIAVAVSIPVFEIYTDTIKPFFRWIFSKKLLA